MKVIPEQQTWVKQAMMIMLALLLVLSSALPLIGGPLTVQAADGEDDADDYIGPGGVDISDFISHVAIEESAEEQGGILALKDLAGNFYWENPRPTPIASERVVGGKINFHQATDGQDTNFLFSTPRKSAHITAPDEPEKAREIFSVQKSGGKGFPWEFNAHTGGDSAKYTDDEIITAAGATASSKKTIAAPNEKVSSPNILNVLSTVNQWQLAINGRNQLTQTKDDGHVADWANTTNQTAGKEYIGYSENSAFNHGNIAEILVANKEFTPEERHRVNSYLAFKYGITLKNDDGATIDYTASDNNTKMWTASKNTGYGNRVTGIGKDIAGGIDQKQAKSQVDDANVTIALGNEIKDLNSENTDTITKEKSFFTFSDNGEDAKFINPFVKDAEDLVHLERVYKVEKTNWQDMDITLQVDKVKDATAYPQYLVVSSDTTFNAQDTFYLLTDGKVTINSDKLADGAYFTFAAPVPKLTAAELKQTQANGNEITLTFDKDVALTDSTGFTIKVGDDTVDLTGATFKVDPTDSKKLIIALPTGTDVTGKDVDVSYDGTGNLTGTNGVPVGEFDMVAGDSFTAALTITKPDTQVTETKPEISGKVEAGSDIKVVIKDKDGNEVTNAGGNAKVDQDGNWTFTPSADLTDGEYTVEVTATKDGKIATKTKNFTVSTKQTVDYTQVTEVTDINPNGVTYDKDTGKFTVPSDVDKFTFKDGDKEIIATKDNQGNWSLTDTIPTPTVDKAQLIAKVNEKGTLTETDYTQDSWDAYKQKLDEAQAVLDNNNATQKEVDDALTALTAAQDGLVRVTPPSYEDAFTITKPDVVTNNPRPAIGGTVIIPSTLTIELTDVNGTIIASADSASVTVNPDGTWSFTPPADLQDGTYTITATATNGTETSTKTHTFTVKTTSTPTVDKSKLQAQADSSNGLTASNYTTSSWNIFQNALNHAKNVLANPNATQKQVDDALASLTAARNALVSNSGGNSGSSGGSGGSGSSTDTTSPIPDGPTTETILVDLVIDGENPIEKTPVTIKRTRETNGEVNDKVELTLANAQDAVNKAKEIGNNVARIIIPDAKDEVTSVTVDIPVQSIALLQANGIDLEIFTNNVWLTIPQTSMAGIDDDFYFRLVPVKELSKQQEIKLRAKTEQVVRDVMQNDDIEVVARPMTIETNLSSRPVLITLPLRDVTFPTDPTEKEAFLKQLAVFIEHTDGEKKLVFGEVVTMPDNTLGLQISVSKFSTFTIINVGKKEETLLSHTAYIKGFTDGTFKPNQNVTRKQIAQMIARNLGYTEDEPVTVAPFKDVQANADGAGAIAYLKQLGIMNGDEHGNFNGGANMTRAQMAAVVANYKKLDVTAVPLSFTDTKNHWAQYAIEANREAGIITGFEDGTFKPQAHLTRAHAVKMINRMFDRGPLNGFETLPFSDVKQQHWAFEEIAEAATTHQSKLDDQQQETLVK